MNVSEARVICPDFDPLRNAEGKTVCRYILPDDMCKLPTHFDYDLVRFVKKPPISVSMTRVSGWQFCERAWAFRYVYRVDAPVTASWKTLGKAFALCRAKIDMGQVWEIPADVTGIDRLRLEVVLEEYQKLPRLSAKSEVRCEVVIETAPQVVKLLGYADGMSADGKTLYEWKYAVDPDNYTRLAVSLQASAYFAGFPLAQEVVIAVARKPKLERLMATPIEDRKFTQEKSKKCLPCEGTGCLDDPGNVPCGDCKGTGKIVEPPRLYASQREKDETDLEFKERVRASVGASGGFFTFKTFPRSEFDLEGTLDFMRRVHHRSTEATVWKVFDPNTARCGDCDYEAVCSSHIKGPGCAEPECTHPTICTQIRLVNGKAKP